MAHKKYTGWKYRCGRKKCRKRYTLSKPIEEYTNRGWFTFYGMTKDGTCGQKIDGKVCGGLLHEDNHNINAWNKKIVCKCDKVGHPHNKGYHKNCEKYDPGQEPVFCFACGWEGVYADLLTLEAENHFSLANVCIRCGEPVEL